MELLVFQSAKNNAMIGFDRSLYKVVVVTKTYLPFLKTFDPVVMMNSNVDYNNCLLTIACNQKHPNMPARRVRVFYEVEQN